MEAGMTHDMLCDCAVYLAAEIALDSEYLMLWTCGTPCTCEGCNNFVDKMEVGIQQRGLILEGLNHAGIIP